jgi:putative oxidoreductase
MATLPKLDWSLDVLANWSGPIAFLGRLSMSYIFVLDGYGAIVNASGVAGYMEANGGLMVASGLGARSAAIALAGFCALTAALFHANGADPEQVINFQKNVAMAGGFLILVAFGPGDWSLDAWRAARRRASMTLARQDEVATIAISGQADAPKTQ